MKNFTIILICALTFLSCDMISGNGNIKTENRSGSEFHAVRVLGSIDVELKSGDNYSIVVEDDDNLLPYIVTNVDGGVLSVHYKDNTSITDDHAKVTITAPSLDKITSSGSGDVKGIGIIKNSSQLEFDFSGSGDVDAQVDAPSVKVIGSGSGNIQLTGRTKDFDCRVSGSGDVNCSNLQSENTKIVISGSGNAHVFASVKLSATTSGSGDVYYSGNPQSPEIHTSGSGNVEPQK